MALVVALAAVGIQWLLWPLIRPHIWLALTAGVFCSAWIGGLPSGLIATVVTGGLGWWLFIAPEPAAFPLSHEIVPMAMFAAISVGLSVLLEQFRRGAERIEELFEYGSDGIFVARLDGAYTSVNQAGCALLGYTRQEILRMNIRDLVPSEDEARLDETIRQLARGSTQVAEWRLRRRDGTYADVEISAKVLPGYRLQGFVRDISARKSAQEQLRLAASVFDSASEAIMVTDAENRLVTVNAAFTSITGFAGQDVLGLDPRFQQSGRHDRAFYAAMWETLQRDGHWEGEIWNRRASGEIYPAWERITAVKDAAGRVSHHVAVLSDISLTKQAEERLNRLAHHDVLTGLPNRLQFMETLEKATERARRHGHKIALAFIDLDYFKRINDTLGHPAGDDLLREIARRLEHAVRAEDTVARLAGDEFVAAFESIARAEDAAHLAGKLLAAVARPVTLDGHEVVVSASIGLAFYPDDAAAPAELMKAADLAMYRAKQSGRHHFEFYAPEMTARAIDHVSLERDLRLALSGGQFRLYYQPQIDLVSGRIAGLEALLRWEHPVRGMILPSQFIGVAEESSIIDDIGSWVIRQAFAQARAWLDEGRQPPRIAVNVSRRQIVHDRLSATIAAARTEMHVPAEAAPFELEITESVLQSMERTADVLHAVRDLGVRVAIDDFGTGYSSLGLLAHLPIDTLKIDYSFMHKIPEDTGSNAIAVAIISMAHTLGLRVIAEGIERDAQVTFLREQGCDEVQGYLFGPAVPAAALSARLESIPAMR